MRRNGVRWLWVAALSVAIHGLGGSGLGVHEAGQVEDIARKLAELRLTHLRAHLLTAALYRPEQIEEYYQFRGYVAPSSGRVLGY